MTDTILAARLNTVFCRCRSPKNVSGGALAPPSFSALERFFQDLTCRLFRMLLSRVVQVYVFSFFPTKTSTPDLMWHLRKEGPAYYLFIGEAF